MAQDYTFDSDKTILEVATAGVSRLIQALDEFEAMNREFKSSDPEFERKYAKALTLLDAHNAYDLEDRVKRTLKSLGIE